MAGVPTEMTLNTTSTVMTSERDNTMRHDNALPVTCHSRCVSHRTMHMSYRSKTYTWNDVILVKRSMIRGFFSPYFINGIIFEKEAIGHEKGVCVCDFLYTHILKHISF